MTGMKSRAWFLAVPLAGLLAFALYSLVAAPEASLPELKLKSSMMPQVSSVRHTPIVEAIERALPSVVNIGTERILTRSYSPWSGANGGPDPFDGLLDDFFRRQSNNQRSYSLGSGSLIDSSGLVVTNAHVVHRASKITITLSDGRNFQAKEVAGDYFNDLSLLQIIDPPADLKPIALAVPNDLLLGETVIAVGNPFGLDSSITQGILSATGRRLTFEGKTLFSDIIQTDAAVYPGNSGGPLINLEGRMIGINMAFHKDAPGIGFAIPLARVENTLAKWLIPERFGNICFGLVPALRTAADGRLEIYLSAVIKDSPAERAGLKPGDVIRSFQGEPADNLLALGRRLIRLKPSEHVTLTLADGRKFAIPLVCMMPRDGRAAARNRLAVGLQELTPQLASALGYPFDGGLIVSDLFQDAPQGVERGDMLVRLGETPIHSWPDIAKALESKPYGDKIQAVFISITMRNGVGFLTKKPVDITLK